MTKKRLINKLAKEIRKNTGRDFVNSIQLSKAFFKNKMLFEETDNIEGFVYEYNSEFSKRGFAYKECMYATGEIYLNNSTIKKWSIPFSFYLVRDSVKKY